MDFVSIRPGQPTGAAAKHDLLGASTALVLPNCADPCPVVALEALATRRCTDHASHKGQASMIRRYIIWRNNYAYDERLRRIVDRSNVA